MSAEVQEARLMDDVWSAAHKACPIVIHEVSSKTYLLWASEHRLLKDEGRLFSRC